MPMEESGPPTSPKYDYDQEVSTTSTTSWQATTSNLHTVSKFPKANTSIRTPSPIQLLRSHDHRHAQTTARWPNRIRRRNSCFHSSNGQRRRQLHLLHAKKTRLEIQRQKSQIVDDLLRTTTTRPHQLHQNQSLLSQSPLHQNRNVRSARQSGI